MAGGKPMQPKHSDKQMSSSGQVGKNLLHVAGHVMVGLAFTVVFALAFALLVKFIWNSIMPAIFDLKTLTFWQAFGIVVLAKLIFGGFGHHIHDGRKTERRDFWHEKWHPSENEISPPGKFSKNWRYYRKYWQDEGKAAFEAYVDKIGDKKDGR